MAVSSPLGVRIQLIGLLNEVQRLQMRRDGTAVDRKVLELRQLLDAPFLVAAFEVVDELTAASAVNPPMNSLHEGYAVILEEMDELKAEVWKNPRKHPDRDALARKEAIQVAAMALRMVTDLL